jgi:hypothetical protein
MAMPFRQSTFTGGLISPEAYGRADLGKYQSGCRTLHNFLALPHGPVQNRPGTEYISHTPYAHWPHTLTGGGEYEFSPVALQAWEYSEDDTYLVAIGHKRIRFYRNGFPVLEDWKQVTAISEADPCVFTVNANGWQHMDMFFTYDALGMTLFNYRCWYVKKYELQIDIVDVTAAATALVTTDGNHGIANGSTVYIDEVSGTIGDLVNKGTHVITTTVNPDEFTIAQDTTLLAGGVGGWTMKRIYGGPPATNNFQVMDQFHNTIDTSGAGEGIGTLAGSAYAARVVELHRYRMFQEADLEYEHGDVGRIHVAQSADIMPMVHRGYAARKLIRNDYDDWDVEKISFESEMKWDPADSVTVVTGPGIDVTWYVTAINKETGEESVPITNTTVDPFTGEVKIRWPDHPDASSYHVYRTDSTLRRAGFVGLLEHVDGATYYEFLDPSYSTVDPNFDLGPPEVREEFGDDGETNNPGCLVWHEQRLFVGSTILMPTQVWGSGRGTYWNHNISVPPVPDDPVSFAVAALKENLLHNLVSMKDLVLITTASEFRVNGGGDEMIAPDRLVSRPQTTNGSSFLQALMIDDSALIVRGTGNQVGNLFYSFEKDGYDGQDLSILGQSIFRGKTVVDWAYAKYPFSAVWMVLSDGKLACLCYHREHKVWAWSDHELPGGKVESVAAVREGSEHAVYVSVRRLINGKVVRYVERIHRRNPYDLYDGNADDRRSFFVDSGKSNYDSWSYSGKNYYFPSCGPGLVEDATFAIEAGFATWTFNSTYDPTTVLQVDDIVCLEGFEGSGAADPVVYSDYLDYAFPEYVNRKYFKIRSVSGAPDYKITLKTMDDVALDEDMCKNWEQTRHGMFVATSTEIAGANLDHLIGQEIVTLADGGVLGLETVVEHAVIPNLAQPITLDDPAAYINTGLPYASRFETLDPEVQKGVIGHMRQSIQLAAVLLRDSRGMWWGPDFDHLVAFPERDEEPYGAAPYLFSGWRIATNLQLNDMWNHSRLCIEQRDPLPMEIQAVVREIETGESSE